MVERSLGIYSRMLRTPDIRLDDVWSRLIRSRAPFSRRFEEPGRSILYYARQGAFTIELENSARGPIRVDEGGIVGVEDGRAHYWRADDGPVELFVGSIPREMSVLQKLTDGIVIVPPEAEPFAKILHLTVELILAEIEQKHFDRDQAVIRRCAEIGVIQLVRFVQSQLASQADVPKGLAHDEYLLRAWTAYFAEPQRRWTVKALAEAAGLGRTAFSERFRAVFGAPPLQSMTAIRLKQAKSMLQSSQAAMAEIAFNSGYSSEAAFVRAFRREFGMPPGRFRASVRGSDS